MAAVRKTTVRMRSEGMRAERMEKREEPPMQATMKAAKMRPKGGAESVGVISAGVQLKTKIYIEPSKREMTPPIMQIDPSALI